MPGLKIEMYQQRISKGSDWLKETQMEKLLVGVNAG